MEAHSSSDPEQSPLYTTSLASATTGAEVEALYARGNDHVTVTLRDGAVMELREDDLSVVSSAMPFGEGGLDLSAICSGDVPAIVYGLGRDGIVRRHALDQREDDIAANEVVRCCWFACRLSVNQESHPSVTSTTGHSHAGIYKQGQRCITV